MTTHTARTTNPITFKAETFLFFLGGLPFWAAGPSEEFLGIVSGAGAPGGDNGGEDSVGDGAIEVLKGLPPFLHFRGNNHYA